MAVTRRKRELRFEILPLDAPSGEPVPITCRTCMDTGVIPGDSVFVNNGHGYGVEYLGAPCPDCDAWNEEE
jgi:hypothetical protein